MNGWRLDGWTDAWTRVIMTNIDWLICLDEKPSTERRSRDQELGFDFYSIHKYMYVVWSTCIMELAKQLFRTFFSLKAWWIMLVLPLTVPSALEICCEEDWVESPRVSPSWVCWVKDPGSWGEGCWAASPRLNFLLLDNLDIVVNYHLLWKLLSLWRVSRCFH